MLIPGGRSPVPGFSSGGRKRGTEERGWCWASESEFWIPHWEGPACRVSGRRKGHWDYKSVTGKGRLLVPLGWCPGAQ
jgi:hypothetical protein